jgi:ADP-ribose pyrophosphatase YjhB (NUDIX family)
LAAQVSVRPPSRQPLPPDARRVFEGQIFDVYQWEQVQFDGSTVLFEKLRRPDTSYVIPVTHDSKLLILRQQQPGSDPAFGLIGGRVEDGESPESAARRELREEAGLMPNGIELWDTYQFLPKIDWAIYTFIARHCRHVERSLDAGEKIELVELSFDELITLAGSESFGDVEVALRLLRLAAHPERLAEARRFVLDERA